VPSERIQVTAHLGGHTEGETKLLLEQVEAKMTEAKKSLQAHGVGKPCPHSLAQGPGAPVIPTIEIVEDVEKRRLKEGHEYAVVTIDGRQYEVWDRDIYEQLPEGAEIEHRFRKTADDRLLITDIGTAESQFRMPWFSLKGTKGLVEIVGVPFEREAEFSEA
jgi:hypothetical protein